MATGMTTETPIASVFSRFNKRGTMHRKSWIHRGGKLAGAALAAGMVLGLAGTAPAAIILYQENFAGSSEDNLNGKAPDIVTSGAHGVPGGAVWKAPTEANVWRQDGSIPESFSSSHSAVLPFQPESGWIYTLSATVHADHRLSTARGGSWTILSFRTGDDTFGVPGNSDAAPWVLYRPASTNDPNYEVVSWAGTGTTGSQSHGAFSNPPITLSMVLDTTESAWSVEWFVNGVSQREHTYTTNPTINHVSFGRNNDARGPFDSFQLTAVPEPGSLALLGAGVGVLLLRRQRS